MNLPNIREADVQGKKVILRCDLDVTMSGQEIADENDLRLVSSLATIKSLLDNGATVIIGGHLGRPGGKFSQELSLEPVLNWFANQFKNQKSKIKNQIGDFEGWEITNNLFLLENLRFYLGEEANDPEFSKRLASLADIYVNDAFAVCHRAHASIVGIPKLLPHFAGIHLQEEVKNLGRVLVNPQRPLVIIIGGAKIETKMPLVLKMNHFADEILVGGLVAQEISSTAIERGKAKIIIADSNPEKTDITRESAEKFLEVIAKAKMIVWNGPMGKTSAGPAARQPQNLPTALTSAGPHFGAPRLASPASHSVNNSEYGTWQIASGIINSQAYKIAGGGDTVEYLSRYNLINKFDFVSTGGGAMLSFLSGEKLPGIEVLISS